MSSGFKFDRRRQKRNARIFDSLATALGLAAGQMTPKPQAAESEMAAMNIPVLSALTRYDMMSPVSGMSGEWNGVLVSVWEGVIPKRGRRVHYRAGFEVIGPQFIIRKGKLAESFFAGSNEPPRVEVGRRGFARKFALRSDSTAGLAQYLTDSRQRSITDLSKGCSYLELTNYTIDMVGKAPLSGDLAEVTNGLNRLTELAHIMMVGE